MKNLKILFTALPLLCCVGMAKAHDFEAGGIYYNILSSTDNSVEVTYKGYNCDSYNNEYTGSVVIPESVNYNGITYSVTSIGYRAFEDCTGLTSITIPNSVTSIGAMVFYNCSGLTSITIPNSVTSIGGYAFYNCKGLTSITIPNRVTSIGGAFKDCTGLTSITIPNSVTSIGYEAFRNCTGLTSITIPNSVTSIGDEAFYNCTGLTSVVIGNSVTSFGNYAFNGCTSLKELRIEDGEGRLSLGYNTYNSSYTGRGLFYDCPLETLYLGRNLSYDTGLYYGYSPFYGIKTLASVTIGNSVTSIGDDAFRWCTGLEKVCINDLAAWCGIDFGSAEANPLCYAKNLYLNGELLTSLTIPAEVAEVKDYAFYNCNGVTNIEIVDGVKSIGSNAFYGCSKLETLYISKTIESIGNNAFAECNNIFDIKIGSKKVITASENIFSTDVYNNAYLYVPDGRKDFYAKTSPWSNFIIREMDYTGIENVKTESGEMQTIYDLTGRKLKGENGKLKGIYIIDGKKVLVK